MARYDRPVTDLLEPLAQVRLTDLTDCGGCAAKLGADLLADALSGLGAQGSPDELIAGLTPPDDAAVYRLSRNSRSSARWTSSRRSWTTPRRSGRLRRPTPSRMSLRWVAACCSPCPIAAFPEDLPRDVLAAIFGGAAGEGA